MNTLWSTDEEAHHLQQRFQKLKKTIGMGQAEFARVNKVPGGPSMLSQHIKARRPISLEAAIAYAKGFGCQIEEISPRRAKELEAARDVQPDPDRTNKPTREAWSPNSQPELLALFQKELNAAGAMPGYSDEALALAWLLDQVNDRLEKKKAETEACAVILRYVN